MHRCVSRLSPPSARTRRRVILFPGAVALLLTLLPTAGAAQIPGGRSLSFDQERATFLATMLGQVRPVVDAWEASWRGDRADPVRLYAPDAVVAVRDSMIGGPRSLEAFARAVREDVGAPSASMLDFDASDRLAYVYGAWSATSPQRGTTAQGRIVTVLRKDDGDWTIRSQLFSADSAAGGLYAALEQVEPLPSLERRVAVGVRAMVPVGRGDREKQDLRAVQRISAYHELIGIMAATRMAWSADDTEGLSALMRENAWVQLPGVADWAGHVSVEDLRRVLGDYGELHTAELDFDYGSTMAYLSGKYWAEQGAGAPLTGSYMAVFQKLGSTWLIRSLTFF